MPNIITLQYVLSDMANHTDERTIIQFINDIVNRLIVEMPSGSLIVCNDINLSYNHNERGRFNTSRYYFDIFYNEVRRTNRNVTCWKYHFDNKVRLTHYDYGNEHPHNGILYNVPPMINSNYNPWLSCSSAQIVIRKGSDR